MPPALAKIIGMYRNGSAQLRQDSSVVQATKAAHVAAGTSFKHSREPLVIATRQGTTLTAPEKINAPPSSQATEMWKPARIAVRASGKILFIDPAEILVAESQGNYVLLQQNKVSHLIRAQIAILADKLQIYGMIRIHRSILVNAAHVESIQPFVTGEYLLHMRGGSKYRVTRTYKKNLQLLASLWIGMDGFADQ